jgi:hypothetical protein
MPPHRLPLGIRGCLHPRNWIFERGDEILSEIDGQRVNRSIDHGFDIRVLELSGHWESLAEDIQHQVAANEPDQNDLPLREHVEIRQFLGGRHFQRPCLDRLEVLVGRLALQTAVAVVLVVEPLEVLALPFEVGVARKPLPSEKLLVVGVVEALDRPVAPRFSDGNEHRCDAVEQTQSDHQAEGAGVADAAMEGQGIVQLEKVRNAHDLPAPQNASGRLPVVLGPLALDVDLMGIQVQGVEGVESAVALDIPRSYEVRLVDVVGAQRLREVGVVNPFRDVSTFF